MPTIVIVGVADHVAAQFEGGEGATAFGCALRRLCELDHIAAIAEEASEDALASHAVRSTVGAGLARSRSIPHVLLQAGRGERTRHGIDGSTPTSTSGCSSRIALRSTRPSCRPSSALGSRSG